MSDFLTSYELYHHGIQGQKWGERRYQYQDGSLTPEGKRRYGYDERALKRQQRIMNSTAYKLSDKLTKAHIRRQNEASERKRIMKDFDKEYMKQLGSNKTNDPSVAAIVATSKMADKYGAEKFNKAYKQQQMINTGKFALGAALAAAGTIALEAAYLRSR